MIKAWGDKPGNEATTKVVFISRMCLSCYRVEHASFTAKESEAFTQLCRVVVQDFLPFVKKCFDALFTESSVEQLALSTPYALRHCKKNKEGEAVFHSARHTLELNMQLDIKSIGGMLKPFAPEVFEDMEKSSLSLDIESLLLNQPVLVSGDATAMANSLSGGSEQDKDTEHSTGSKLTDLLVDGSVEDGTGIGDRQTDLVIGEGEESNGTATGTLGTLAIGENGLPEDLPAGEDSGQRTSELTSW